MKNNLRLYLAVKKMTVSDLERGTGISRNVLDSLYHEESTNPTLGTLTKICDYLDISLYELLDISPTRVVHKTQSIKKQEA